jgi:hypothetical protein
MLRAILEKRPTLDDLFGPNIEAEKVARCRELDALIETEIKGFMHLVCEFLVMIRRWEPRNPPSEFELTFDCVALRDDLEDGSREVDRLQLERDGLDRDKFRATILAERTIDLICEYLYVTRSVESTDPPSEFELTFDVDALRDDLEDRSRKVDRLQLERDGLGRDKFWATNLAERTIDRAIDPYSRPVLYYPGIWELMFAAHEMVPLKGEPVPCDEKCEPTFHVHLFPGFGYRLYTVLWALANSIRRGEEAANRAHDSFRSMLERFAALARISVDLCLSAIDEAVAMLRRRDPVAAGTASSAPTSRDLIGELLSPRVLAAGGGFGLFVIRC